MADQTVVNPAARKAVRASHGPGIVSESRPTELDVLVIGGGQAGLAMGHELRTVGLRYQILERHSRVGDSWRQRYDSLLLFTPRSYSALPGLAVPGDPDGYPGKSEIADYLESYVAHFALPVRLNTVVQSLGRTEGGFRATTMDDTTFEARSVVMASGAYPLPNIPAIASAFSPDVRQVPAASYRNPASVPPGTVLVVGDGASGRQIALELAATQRVLLATGRHRSITPDRVLGRSIFWWIDRLGLVRASRKSRIGQRLMAADSFPGRRLQNGRLSESGVTLVSRLAGAEGTMARFADGKAADIRSVVWAAGYHEDSRWVEIPKAKNPDGSFAQSRGVSPIPGLYFVGKKWQWTGGSALLLGVGADARYVAADIARHLNLRVQSHHV